MWFLICIIITLILIIVFAARKVFYYLDRADRELDKYNKSMEFYFALVRWLELKQENSSFAKYFVENNYKTVAVYGMKELGVLLCKELKNAGVEVVYALDKNVENISADVPVLLPKEGIPDVDVIVVTAIHYFNHIYTDLVGITDADIVSIEDVLWEM